VSDLRQRAFAGERADAGPRGTIDRHEGGPHAYRRPIGRHLRRRLLRRGRQCGRQGKDPAVRLLAGQYPYPAEAQTDPCNKKPSNYRALRGGSWSWYGHSQRATDREFNSPNYPGHAYYGFRVVVSEAGRRKIVKTGGR
jgi:hypothetical protein